MIVEPVDNQRPEQAAADRRVDSETDTSPRDVPAIEIEHPDSGLKTYADIAALRSDVLEGEIKGHWRARRRQPLADSGDDGEPTQEQTVEWQTVAGLDELRSVYRPVWGTALDYVGPGILVGIVLKALDTTITLFAIDETAGVLWLLAIGAIVASARFGIIPIVMYFFFTFQHLGQIPNFFMTAMAVALVGAVFGGPGGMVVGSVVGFLRSRKLRRSLGIENEGMRPWLLGLVLPAIFLATALPLYIFWFTPLLIEWLS